MITATSRNNTNLRANALLTVTSAGSFITAVSATPSSLVLLPLATAPLTTHVALSASTPDGTGVDTTARISESPTPASRDRSTAGDVIGRQLRSHDD